MRSKLQVRRITVSDSGMKAALTAVRRSPLQSSPEVDHIVQSIISEVRERGDEALLELGRKFDSPTLSVLEVSPQEWQAGIDSLDSDMNSVLSCCAANIRRFHLQQYRASWFDPNAGKLTGQLIRPLRRVGLYIPGGTALYPSSVLMVAIPAQVAGVEEIVLCTPCGRDGSISPAILAAARISGVNRIFKIGGAQAIAAMAFGTETVPAVDKIAGPGNTYVNIAKKQLWGLVDIDMLAGPSEVCVIADAGAYVPFVAADLLTQSEHDTESSACLLTDCSRLADDVLSEMEARLPALPRRDILLQSLEHNGVIVVTEDLHQACELANHCAPEHLALMVRDPMHWVGRIHNAGAILLGDYTPQTLGDYAAGPSHTLPTSGTARFSSPLNVDTFLKKTNFIQYDRQSLLDIAPTLIRFATYEGFEAHAEAVRQRINYPLDEANKT